MKASHCRSGKQPLLVEADDLESLCELISSFSEHIRITAKCRDNIEREPENLGELIAYENALAREIIELRIIGRSDDWERSVRLKLSNSLLESFSLDIEGPEDSVSQLADTLQEKLVGMRPWYASAAKTSMLAFGVSITVFLALASIIIANILPKTPADSSAAPETWQRNAFIWGIAFALLFGPPILGVVLDRVKARVFPVATFAIGQGLKRHNTGELVRSVVILGFVVSLVAGVVSYWITKIG